MPVAVYARVSTQRQDQAQTTDKQLDRLRAHAAGQGWSLAADRVFRDDGYSGASLRRPGLDRLRDAAAGARLDRILITEPDRLARNYVHQALLVEELQKHGAEVVFLDRPMSRDPHDQLLLQIRGAVAEYERTLIAERMRRGRLRKLRAGTLLPWTRPPYGYRLDPERPRDPAGVRLDEAEAAVVRDLFAWFADEGATILAMRQRLARLGIASPRGHRTWNASALHGVLTNPTDLGQIFANRARTRPAERRHSALLPIGRGLTGARQSLDAAEWIAVAAVPALVGQAQFDRAQERLAYNRRMARRNNRVHAYLLRGLVSCGRCRMGCTGLHMPTGYDYYVCRTKTRMRFVLPGGRCPARYIPARPLEELVWRDLCEVLSAPEMVAHAMERARGGHWLAQEMQARRANLRRGRAALVQHVERLTEAYLAGVVSLAEYERRRRDTDARLLALAGVPGAGPRARRRAPGRDGPAGRPCRGVLPARAGGPGRGGLRPKAGPARTAGGPRDRHRRRRRDPLRRPDRPGGGTHAVFAIANRLSRPTSPDGSGSSATGYASRRTGDRRPRWPSPPTC